MRFTFSPDAKREGCNVQALVGLSYSSFLDAKMHVGSEYGFDPVWMPDFLYDFQKVLVEWAVCKGRSAIFADCGLGKTPMQLVWAEKRSP